MRSIEQQRTENNLQGRRIAPFFYTCILIVLLASITTAHLASAQNQTPSPVSFFAATTSGDIEKVKALLDAGFDINSAKSDGARPTALNLSLQNEHYELARFLIERGADVNQSRLGKVTALHDMAELGNTEWCRELLKAGANIHDRSDLGWTALHYAVNKGHSKTVQYLHEAGANLDTPTFAHQTPLSLAFNANNTQLMELLIELGADVIIPDRDGISLFEKVCARETFPLIGTLYARLEAGPDAYRIEQLDRGLHQAFLTGSTKLAEFMIARGANPERTVGSRYSALHFAAELGHSEFVEMLLDKGVDIDSRTPIAKWTPLHFACANARQETVKLLCEKGANPNAPDPMNRTPLHLVSMRANIALAGTLISHEADTQAQDLLGNTPLHYAAGFGKVYLVRMFAAHPGASDMRNKSGQTPADMAIASGFHQIATLIETIAGSAPANIGADLPAEIMAVFIQSAPLGLRAKIREKVRRSLREGDTPLHIAIEYDSPVAARMIMRENEEAYKQRDAYGFLPIHRAADQGRAELVALLIARGSPFNDAKNRARWTPLHFAASSGNESIVDTLLTAGARTDLVDGNGRDPAAVAAILRQAAIEHMLNTHTATATNTP